MFKKESRTTSERSAVSDLLIQSDIQYQQKADWRSIWPELKSPFLEMKRNPINIKPSSRALSRLSRLEKPKIKESKSPSLKEPKVVASSKRGIFHYNIKLKNTAKIEPTNRKGTKSLRSLEFNRFTKVELVDSHSKNGRFNSLVKVFKNNIVPWPRSRETSLPTKEWSNISDSSQVLKQRVKVSGRIPPAMFTLRASKNLTPQDEYNLSKIKVSKPKQESRRVSYVNKVIEDNHRMRELLKEMFRHDLMPKAQVVHKRKIISLKMKNGCK